MPKFKKSFEITGEVEVVADDPHHAQALFDRMTKEQWAANGELETFEIEEIPRDRDGELADKHWNRVKEGAL